MWILGHAIDKSKQYDLRNWVDAAHRKRHPSNRSRTAELGDVATKPAAWMCAGSTPDYIRIDLRFLLSAILWEVPSLEGQARLNAEQSELGAYQPIIGGTFSHRRCWY